MMRYAIVIENAGSNFSAYVPDLPACIATGATVEEVEREIRAAIEFHIGLPEDGPPVPPPFSAVGYVEIAPEGTLDNAEILGESDGYVMFRRFG